MDMDAIEKIRKEIDHRIDILEEVSIEQQHKGDSEMSTYYHGKAVSLQELLSFIDTIEEEHFRESTKKIEPLERPYQDAYSGLVLDIPQLVEKINEIIQYINEKEKEG